MPYLQRVFIWSEDKRQQGEVPYGAKPSEDPGALQALCSDQCEGKDSQKDGLLMHMVAQHETASAQSP